MTISARRGRKLLVLVLVIAVLAPLATFWWLRKGRYVYGRWVWQPEQVELLPDMRQAPVTGWRTSTLDLGLPSASASGSVPIIAVSNVPNGPKPLIGASGERAYFLATSLASADPQWWLAGIDTGNGHRVFDALLLSTGTLAPTCLLNGPDQILCVERSRDGGATVIDADSGDVIYRGPTDIKANNGSLNLRQLGPYAVATSQDKGIYGIGSRAETTWFVPGDGSLAAVSETRVSGKGPVLSAQRSTDLRRGDSVVFSVSDGRPLEPDIETGASLHDPVVYPGGFAANVQSENRRYLGTYFFDESGRTLAKVDGRLVGSTLIDLPVIALGDSDGVTVFTPAGDRLLDVADQGFNRVGTTLFLMENGTLEFPEWRQYDLKTGAKGAVCDFPMHRLLGTDGSTLVFQTTNRQAGRLASARDMATCADLWVLPAEPDSLQRVWRIGSHLVQLSADGTELSSLVPRPQ